MKLIIKEHGDSSVGIQERYYEIECPFERDEFDEYFQDEFKASILPIYQEYTEMKIDAFYDFEMQNN